MDRRRDRGVLVFAVLLAIGVAAAAPAGDDAEKRASWKMKGELEESCSCDAACPC